MKVVTFGEMMVRLKSPQFERLFQSPLLEATFGGGEANVAASLARFGLDAAFVTVLPKSPLGDAAIAELRSQGVDTSRIVRSGERMGIYFLETGSNVYLHFLVQLASPFKTAYMWYATVDGVLWESQYSLFHQNTVINTSHSHEREAEHDRTIWCQCSSGLDNGYGGNR
jgi:2-dehydro-3-deoxygluconokinase